MAQDTLELELLRFPIGKFVKPDHITEKHIQSWIEILKDFPTSVETISKSLNSESLNWKYRPEGWNIRQVIHHCADSHMNGIIRTKLALTEDNPTIKPYPENLWAELEDSKLNIKVAIQTLKGVHSRWSEILNSLNKEQMEKTFFHPEDKWSYSIAEQCGLYAWHCNHHFAHIEQAIASKGRFN